VTRIVAGVAGGRRLSVPRGDRTRPTSERVREALFSTLTSLAGPLHGQGVLDLYAGSGALGLEALSRGAAWCLFVEKDPRALRALEANVSALGLPGAQVRRGDVVAVLGRPAPRPVSLVLADPPYALPESEVEQVLGLLTDGWLEVGGLLVLERSARASPPTWPDGWHVLADRRYGETRLWYLRRVRTELQTAAPMS
jgi:16S rRNA (guanine966-N2)-methyltransferase